MKIEDHLEAFKEHKEVVFDWAYRIRGLDKSQRIVGLHVSRGIVELLSAYLHEKNRISSGAQINHRWFKSESVSDKLPEFPQKNIIVKKIVEMERLSEDLSYGSPEPIEKIKTVLELFIELEKMINDLRGK